MWGFPAVARNVATRASHIRAIQLTDSIVAESSPGANGLRVCLVLKKPQCELQAGAFAAVAIFRDAHILLPCCLSGRTLLGNPPQKTTGQMSAKITQMQGNEALNYC